MKLIKGVLIIIYFFSYSTTCQNLIEDLSSAEKKEHLIKTKKDSLFLHTFRVTDIHSIVYGLELYYLKIPLSSVKINVKEVNQTGNTDTIYENQKSLNSIAIISGGFWGYDMKNNKMPLGLIIDSKSIKSKQKNWSTGGVLIQENSKISIRHIKEFDLDPIIIEEGIQSKPILVKDGQNDIYSNNKNYFDRICIGFTYSNELIICGVFNDKGRGISLYEFSEILITKELPNFPNVELALAMDGGPSSHIFIPSLKMHIGYNKTNYIPNVIELINR